TMLFLALSAAALLYTTDAAAQAYPSKPVRMIIPFPPGGSNDVVGRMIAFQLSERLGRQVVVDNQGGAGGIIGTEAVARAPADGYTLLLISVAHAFGASMYKLPYDPINAFAPVALLGTGPVVLAVTANLPVNSLKDLLALAKEKPGQLNYASAGVGSFQHLASSLFKLQSGLDIVHIPFKGGGPAMMDVIAGNTQIAIGSLIQTLPHIRSGRLKPLGVGSAKLEAARAVIGEVRIDNRNIFDLTDEKENGILYRAANAIHIQTRAWVVRRQLLFKPGERVSARLIEETERLMRSNRIFYDVSFVPVAYRDGVVDIEVRTRDTWTLEPGASASRAGGVNKTGWSVRDTNALGTGVLIGANRATDADRTATVYRVTLPHAFDGWTAIDYSHSRLSD